MTTQPAQSEPDLWICDTCGMEYTADVGKCGVKIPPCDGTVRPAPPLLCMVAKRSMLAFPFVFAYGEMGKLELPATGLREDEATRLKQYVDSLVTEIEPNG